MNGRKTRKAGADDSDRKHLTGREVERLIEATKGSRNEVRDRCLMLLLFRHGLRVSEACRMKLDQVDTEKSGVARRPVEGRAFHGAAATRRRSAGYRRIAERTRPDEAGRQDARAGLKLPSARFSCTLWRYPESRSGSMSIDISRETEARITDEARRQGVSVDALLERLMSERGAAAHVVPPPGNGSIPAGVSVEKVPILHLGVIGPLHRRDIYDDVR